MFFLSKSGLIGIDVGTYTIKFAQLNKVGNQFQLRDHSIIRRNQPWVKQTFHDEEPVSSKGELLTITSLSKQLLGTQAAACASMAFCDVRSHQTRGGNDLERITEELGKIGKRNPKERIVNFTPVGDKWLHEKDENVLSISISREWSDQFIDDHEKAGLQCVQLDGIPTAIARSTLLVPNLDITQPVGVIDWGFTRSTFTVCAEGKPLFVRILRGCGLQSFIHKLQETFFLSYDEAQSLLTDRFNLAEQDSTKEQRSIQKVINNELARIEDQITRTMSFLRSYRRKISPSKILLMGGGSSLCQVENWMESFVGVPCSRWSISENGSSSESLVAIAASLSLLGFNK